MKRPRKNGLEWIVFALSLVLVLGTAAILLHEALSSDRQPADVQMQLGPTEVHEGYFAVPVAVENRGDITAENVHLEVILHLPAKASEQSEFDLPYLPRRATRHAWVTFRNDPARGKLEARVLGYQKP